LPRPRPLNMATVEEGKMREEIKMLLVGVDLASTSIGKLRAELEQRLGLEAGALEARKDQVNRLLQDELVKHIQAQGSAAQEEERADTEDKKRKAESKTDAEPPKKKEKKDKEKKEKDKKSKKAKKDEGSGDERRAAAAKDADAPTVSSDAPVAPASPVQEATTDVAKEPEPTAVAQEPPPAAGAEPIMLMPQFEEFDPTKELSQKAVARTRTFALTGAEDSTLRLWDLESYGCIRTFEGHSGSVHSVDVDWENNLALSGADEGARLWDLTSGGCQKAFALVEEGCHVVAANWKKETALAGCGDGRLRLWDMKSGDELKNVLAHQGGVWALEANWVKKRVASGGDLHLKLWDAEDWSCLQKVEGHPGGIMCLSVDWDEMRALVGSGEQSLRLWDLETREPRNLLGHRDAVACLCASWDGEVAVALSGGWDAQLRLWNPDKGSLLQSHECKFGRVRSMDVDFVSMQAACGASTGKLHFIDLHSGMMLRTLEGHVGGITAVKAKF